VKSGEVGRDQRKKLRVYSQNSRFSIFTWKSDIQVVQSRLKKQTLELKYG
jgi:hypothetical protein